MAALLLSVALAACSVVGVRETEEPPFTVVGRVGVIEIRRYEARAVAETTVDAPELAARSEGFSRLAGYIFGRNVEGTKIEMTAPVAQSGPAIRFFLPRSVSAESAPRPADPRVRLSTVAEETVAVLRFSGSTSPEAMATRQAELVAALTGSEWLSEGAPFSWFYDPPWTLPPFRRNEAVVRVLPKR